MKRILKTRVFSRWMRKTELENSFLMEAVDEMEHGLVDADLGAGIYKKRIALPGRGKRGCVRTLIATNRLDRWIFLTGFEKNERSNISKKELYVWKMIAHDLLSCADAGLKILLTNGELEEINYE